MSLFHKRGSWTPEPFVPPYPGAPMFGIMGTPSSEQALRLSAVWACVRMISDAVSMMPLEAYTMRAGKRVPLKDAGPLLTKPSADATRSEWVQMLMTSLLLRGNAYGQIVQRGAFGLPTQIELANPDVVRLNVDASGRLNYTFAGHQLPFEDVFHIRGMRIPGSLMGLSPIEYAAKTLNLSASAQEFGYGFFQDGAHPSGILTTDQPVSQENATILKERFKAGQKGRDTAVLGAGVKYQQIQVSPDESQFLQTQMATVSDIARIFGVPSEMIGGTGPGGMTYSNVTQRYLDFLTLSVQRWLNRLEDAITPLVPGAKHVLFDTSVLLRMTPSDKWGVNVMRINTGAVTINELRAIDGLEPVAWGNEPYLPGMHNTSAGKAIEVDPALGEPT
jgi:HK97 family phage portal protein